MNQRAFTLLEMVITMTILAILAAVALPTAKTLTQRQKEVELRRILLEVRTAIDRYKTMSEKGEIQVKDIAQMGYPEDLEQLIEGMPLAKHPGQVMRFLRKIPKDPFTGESEWGLRSVQDDPDSNSWGGQNIFDVYSLSDGVGLDGSEYSTW